MKKVGLPQDAAVAVLKEWAHKNRPEHGKRTITETEIIGQASSAYSGGYSGYGCSEEALKLFCDESCPMRECWP
jgi:hypothetical protein